MNKFILISLILFSFGIEKDSICNSSSGIIKYNVSFDYLQRDKKESQSDKIIKHISSEIENLECVLKFNNNESLFYIDEGMISDKSIDAYVKSAKRMACDGVIYNNSSSNLKLTRKEFLKKEFLISDTLKIKWNITNEKIKIGSYTCYKATSFIEKNDISINGIELEAWFTPEIPVSFGPKGYGGLPGLILKLKENKFTYTYNKVKLLSKTEPIIIEKPKEGKHVTFSEYQKLVLKMINEFNFE